MAVKYSNNFEAIRSRIRRMPELAENAISGFTKKNLLEINQIFHDGIKKNGLGLEPLAEITVGAKRRAGYKNPNTPLYGKGDDAEERSYMNMMNIMKVPMGWKLYPSHRMHWTKKITLDFLFKIHEHGATIRASSGSFIRIIPRPALFLSYLKWQTQKKKNDPALKKAVKEFIINGNEKLLKNYADYIAKQEMKIAQNN
jgi:hypothetical protein